jgi:hypothetical protein
MDKEVVSKKSGYYLDFLNKGSKEGYEFTYFSEEIIDGKDVICLRLNIDCETYVLGDKDMDEILEELNDEESYVSFGFDQLSLRILIINKDNFFNKYIVQLKEYIKKSVIGKDVQAINFYRRKGSEIYPPEVSISIKSSLTMLSHDWIDVSVQLMTLLGKYKRDKGLNQLEFITPMSIMNGQVF